MLVGQRRFQLQNVIGRGAFGVVWRALDRESGDDSVAMKVVNAKDGPAFATASFEAELLQILTLALPSGRPAQRLHAPLYLAHSATRNASGGGTVRLAMSYLPGIAVDRWLYGISDEEHKSVDVAQLVDGHLPGGQQGSMWLAEACATVKNLLLQLSGVFMHLMPIAFHRDVSSHNVLVHFREGDGCDPQSMDFSLIDFGLAVRSGSWPSEWRQSNLAGDPRYWAPAAWMAFAFGFKYVGTHPNPGFQQQYVSRMDQFATGIMGLEVLFALWHAAEAYDGSLPGALEIRAAWCRLWVQVVQLFQLFHRRGAQEVRQHLAQSHDEGVTGLVGSLRQLRAALRQAALYPQHEQWASLLRLLADLVDERGAAQWADFPTWLSGEDGEDPTEPSFLPPKRASAGQPATPRASSHRKEPLPRSSHRRLRSTGGTVDRELTRLEPSVAAGHAERSDALSLRSSAAERSSRSADRCGGRAAAAIGGETSSSSRTSSAVDSLSRSFSHAR